VTRRRACLVLIALLTTPAALHADDWPAWRGPRGDGVSTEKHAPLEWSATKNVRWKVALPEPGNSTPIVWGDWIFLTQALDGGKRRALVAYDRGIGRKLWQQEVPCSTKETTHRQNPPCSSSPVTDGKAVYAYFASAGVLACDLDGKVLWQRELGPVLHKWGNGPSPMLYKDLLIFLHGPGEPTFLIALDKSTGKTAWKSPETSINSPIFGSWSTPVVIRAGGRDELILPLPGDKIGGDGLFKAYDPATGKELWRCWGLGNEIYAMPVVSPKGDLVVGISGHNGPLLAVRPGGSGDVTATHLAWRSAGKNPQRIGAGMLHEGRLYIPDALPGAVQCLDAQTGEMIWKERVGDNIWGSMLLAAGRIYVTAYDGTTYVLAAGPKFELLATNVIPEATYAALAISNGDLFVRTYQHLYCIRESK
jgi:outer membrane protein assembly factor BamB